MIDRGVPRGAWRAALLLTIGYTAYYFCRTNFSVGRPAQVAELGEDGAILLGRIATLGIVAGIAGKFLAGRVVRLFGGRGAFLLGMLGSALATIGMAFSSGLGAFGALWCFNRLLQTLGWPATVKIVGGWFPPSAYGRAMGIVSLSWLFGDALARAGQAQLLTLGWGWRPLFLASAAGLGTVLLLCLLFLQESRSAQPPQGLPAGERTEVRGTLPKGFFAVAAGALAFTLVNVTLSEWLPLYFSKRGLSEAGAALASGLFPTAGGVSAFTFGWLSDRTDARGRLRLLVGSLVLAAATLAGFLLPLPPLLLVGLAGLATGGPYAWAVGAAALDLGPQEKAATLNGYLDGTGYLGALLAGEAIARLARSLGWNGAFAACGIVCLLCAAIAGIALGRKTNASPKIERHGTDSGAESLHTQLHDTIDHEL
jgi:OPA family glycerol-3-phosphate transporter-like MFS transporter